MAYPVKNKERHDFYYMVENPAINYKDFLQRCRNNKHKLDKEFMEKLIMIPVVKYSCKVDNNGRECSICREYKLWDNFIESIHSSYWYTARCKKCVRVKSVIPTEKIVYTTVSSYVSPLKVRPRKWQMLSVKDIVAMEWIDKKYCSHIRQLLYLWRDIKKVVPRYIWL